MPAEVVVKTCGVAVADFVSLHSIVESLHCLYRAQIIAFVFYLLPWSTVKSL